MWKVFFTLLAMLVISTTVLIGIRWAAAPAEKAVERSVLVNSHQYQESNNQRAKTLRASLVEAQEASRLDPKNEQLKGQVRTIKALIQATM